MSNYEFFRTASEYNIAKLLIKFNDGLVPENYNKAMGMMINWLREDFDERDLDMLRK